jgi:hypothetical protein
MLHSKKNSSLRHPYRYEPGSPFDIVEKSKPGTLGELYLRRNQQLVGGTLPRIEKPRDHPVRLPLQEFVQIAPSLEVARETFKTALNREGLSDANLASIDFSSVKIRERRVAYFDGGSRKSLPLSAGLIESFRIFDRACVSEGASRDADSLIFPALAHLRRLAVSPSSMRRASSFYPSSDSFQTPDPETDESTKGGASSGESPSTEDSPLAATTAGAPLEEGAPAEFSTDELQTAGLSERAAQEFLTATIAQTDSPVQVEETSPTANQEPSSPSREMAPNSANISSTSGEPIGEQGDATANSEPAPLAEKPKKRRAPPRPRSFSRAASPAVYATGLAIEPEITEVGTVTPELTQALEQLEKLSHQAPVALSSSFLARVNKFVSRFEAMRTSIEVPGPNHDSNGICSQELRLKAIGLAQSFAAVSKWWEDKSGGCLTIDSRSPKDLADGWRQARSDLLLKLQILDIVKFRNLAKRLDAPLSSSQQEGVCRSLEAAERELESFCLYLVAPLQMTLEISVNP